jgi:hypothetical protein
LLFASTSFDFTCFQQTVYHRPSFISQSHRHPTRLKILAPQIDTRQPLCPTTRTTTGKTLTEGRSAASSERVMFAAAERVRLHSIFNIANYFRGFVVDDLSWIALWLSRICSWLFRGLRRLGLPFCIVWNANLRTIILLFRLEFLVFTLYSRSM